MFSYHLTINVAFISETISIISNVPIQKGDVIELGIKKKVEVVDIIHRLYGESATQGTTILAKLI